MSGTTLDDESDDPDESDEASSQADDCRRDGDADHVADVSDGSGCTEIWEHLSELRENSN